MNFLSWVILGLLIGVVANLIAPEKDAGNFLEILILSSLGAILGGFLANLLLEHSLPYLNFPSLLIAFLGAVTLIITTKFFAQRV